jgi:hypothetical protein
MDAIDRLIQNKIFEDRKTIEIHAIPGVKGIMPGLIQIYFLGFVPSAETLDPLERLLKVEGFQQFHLEFSPNNTFQFYLPRAGWTIEEVTQALKLAWEDRGFNVVIEESGCIDPRDKYER